MTLEFQQGRKFAYVNMVGDYRDMVNEKQAIRRKRSSKYEERVEIDATPQEVARSLFNGKPKPKSEWRFLKRDQVKLG